MNTDDIIDNVVGIVEDAIREVDGEQQLETLDAIIEALQEMRKVIVAFNKEEK